MKHPITEQILNRGHWSWDYLPEIEIESDIDWKVSIENPARLDRSIDNPRMMTMAEAMVDGVEFPAIVVLKLDPLGSKKKYLIATGVHRIAAAKYLELKKFDAYVVTEPDTYRAELLIRQLNTIEGQGVRVRERIIQVLHLRKAYPDRSLHSMCKEWHLKDSYVRLIMSEKEGKDRARELGYDITNTKVSNKQIGVLNQIHSNRRSRPPSLRIWSRKRRKRGTRRPGLA
jgi:ParB-like nuclease domain